MDNNGSNLLDSVGEEEVPRTETRSSHLRHGTTDAVRSTGRRQARRPASPFQNTTPSRHR